MPLLILIYAYNVYKKHRIPKWFWSGILGLILGIVFLLASPATMNGARIGDISTLFDIYKYFEAFFYILFLNSYSWALYGLPCFIIFGIFFYKNIKKEKDILNPVNIIPLLMFIFAWFCVGIFVISPENYYGRTANFGLFFLYISVGLVLKSHMYLYPSSNKTLKKLTIGSIILSLIFYIVLIPFWVHFNIQYNIVTKQIQQAKQQNISSITIKPFSQYKINTPFGAILPMYIHLSPIYYKSMAKFYEIDSIQVEQQ